VENPGLHLSDFTSSHSTQSVLPPRMMIGVSAGAALLQGQSNVARWLSPKPAKCCHEKLLDPAKKHVTTFQLKSAKKTCFFEVLKINL